MPFLLFNFFKYEIYFILAVANCDVTKI